MSRSAVSARLRSTKVMRLPFTGVMIMGAQKGNILQGLRAYIRLPQRRLPRCHAIVKFAGTALVGAAMGRAGRGAASGLLALSLLSDKQGTLHHPPPAPPH
jgi:hypothetical protein